MILTVMSQSLKLVFHHYYRFVNDFLHRQTMYLKTIPQIPHIPIFKNDLGLNLWATGDFHAVHNILPIPIRAICQLEYLLTLNIIDIVELIELHQIQYQVKTVMLQIKSEDIPRICSMRIRSSCIIPT